MDHLRPHVRAVLAVWLPTRRLDPLAAPERVRFKPQFIGRVWLAVVVSTIRPLDSACGVALHEVGRERHLALTHPPHQARRVAVLVLAVPPLGRNGALVATPAHFVAEACDVATVAARIVPIVVAPVGAIVAVLSEPASHCTTTRCSPTPRRPAVAAWSVAAWACWTRSLPPS